MSASLFSPCEAAFHWHTPFHLHASLTCVAYILATFLAPMALKTKLILPEEGVIFSFKKIKK
jgi:hypothetical protein